jgi:hypothetical protein
MSKTDKTRPYDVKKAELDQADPYRARREWAFEWHHEFRCGRSCKTCWGWWAKAEDRRARNEGKRQARNWRKDYE